LGGDGSCASSGKGKKEGGEDLIGKKTEGKKVAQLSLLERSASFLLGGGKEGGNLLNFRRELKGKGRLPALVSKEESFVTAEEKGGRRGRSVFFA